MVQPLWPPTPPRSPGAIPPPVAQNATVGAKQNTPQPIPLTASSAAGLPLTYRVTFGPAHGSVTVSGATATYTSAPTYTGTDQFTFVANDGSSDSNTATVSITVIPVNQPPVAGTLNRTTLERLAGDPLATYYVTEIGQGAIAKVSVDSAGHATVQSNFAVGLAGDDSLVFDHHGHIVASNESTGDLTLIDATTGRIITRALNSTKVPILADLAMDPNSDNVYGISFRGNGPLGIVKISLTNGAVTSLNPDKLDGFGGIAISPDGSRLFADSVSGGDLWELDPATGHVLRHTGAGGGADGMTIDPITGHLYIASSVNGTITEFDLGTPTAPALTYLSGHFSGFNTADGITTDGGGNILIIGGFSNGRCCLNRVDPRANTSTQITNAIPSPDDVAPAAGAGAPLGGPLTIPVSDLITASTPSSPTLHLTVASATATATTHGTVTLANGQVTYLSDFGYSGPASFQYRICDDATLNGQPNPRCATGTINITVTPRHAPTTGDTTALTAENSPVTIAPPADSTDGRPIQLLVVNQPAHGTVTASSGTLFQYTPAANYNGPDTFTYKANDGYLESPPSTATITVTPVNQPPTITPQAKTAIAGQPLAFPATDLLGGASPGPANETSQTLTVTGVTSISDTHGTISLTGSTITYTSEALFTGTATATFTACDNGTTNGAPDPKCATGTLTITVSAGPPPTAADTSVSVTENGVGTFGLRGSSSLGRSLTYQVANAPANGTVTISGSSATYTPVTNFNGNDTFTFTVNDGLQMSKEATVAITITAVNQPPTAIAQTKNATAGQPLAFPATDLLAGSSPGPSNESSQTLTVTTVTPTPDTHGALALASGQVSYTPDATFTGTATANYTICDNGTTNGQPDPQCLTAVLSLVVQATPQQPPLTSVTSSQDSFTSGQTISLIATVTNDTNQRCELSPGALTITNVTLNGINLAPDIGGLEAYKKPNTKATFTMANAGSSIAVNVTTLKDTIGNQVLTTTSLATDRAEAWTFTAPGRYDVSLAYDASTVPWGPSDACPGRSQNSSVMFSIGSATTPAPAVAIRQLAASVNLPTYIAVSGTAIAPAEDCFFRFQNDFPYDPASVLSDLSYLIQVLPVNSGYLITIDDTPNLQSPEEGRGSDNSGAATFDGHARISWDDQGYFDPTYTYSPSSPGVGENICATLYHELAHVRDALELANTSADYKGNAGADLALSAECSHADTLWPVQAGEANALTAENSYRSFHGLPLRTSHDSEGVDYIPFDVTLWIPQGACDPPPPGAPEFTEP